MVILYEVTWSGYPPLVAYKWRDQDLYCMFEDDEQVNRSQFEPRRTRRKPTLF